MLERFLSKQHKEAENMKKKRIITVIALICFIATIPGMATASQSQFKDAPDITVAVDGKLVTFPDQPPVIDTKNNRTLVPVRFPAETLGADVDWKQETQEVFIDQKPKDKLPESHLILKIGSQTIMVNSKNERMDTTPIVIKQRTLVPIRFISEYLGAEVKWWQNSGTVHVFTKGQSTEEQQKIIDEVAKQVKPEQPPIVKPTAKIEGTPFYQATSEQIQACKNAPLPSYTRFGFNEMDAEDTDASYAKWGYRFDKVPYTFVTDKSLVFMSVGAGSYFRGYMDLKDGAGTKMVDITFSDRQVSIIDVYDRSRTKWIQW